MNSTKLYRNDLIKQASAENPDFLKQRKLIGIYMIVFIASRVLFSIIETVFCLSREISISNCILNYVLILVASSFAVIIYNGTKPLLYLLIVGSVFTPFKLLTNAEVIENLKQGDSFYNFYIYSLLFVSLIQLVVCICILVNKKANIYFSKAEQINKDILAMNKGK